ncbi:MAG: S-layer homology domain-containing protein [Candidatus Limnocylindrales bacterium]
MPSAPFGVSATWRVFLALVIIVPTIVWVGPVSALSGRVQPPGVQEHVMRLASSKALDLRKLPQVAGPDGDEGLGRDEMEEPEPPDTPRLGDRSSAVGSGTSDLAVPAPTANSFEGMHYTEACTGGACGAGHPPDTNGDVGRLHYVQVINTSMAIYLKSTGQRLVGITFDALMSEGSFGNLCDTDNFGDPVVLYDTFENRWIVTDFAFQLTNAGTLAYPPGAYQCFAVSHGENPVTSGWSFYSLAVGSSLHDYEKLAVWPDGLYMTANMYTAGFTYLNVRVWAFDKLDMYASASTVDTLAYDMPPTDTGGGPIFTVLPSNARVQAGAPPTGAPNFLASNWGYYNKTQVWKFSVNWTTNTGSVTGPTLVTSASYNDPPDLIPTKNGNDLDSLGSRNMVQNQYSKVGSAESIWLTHTVLGSSSSQAAVRWYQLSVTGGTISASAAQASTYNPDTQNRWMSSLAVDRAGNMAIGYSVASATLYPAIRYAGRLVTDPVNTLGQTEASLIEGGGSQTHIFSDGTDDERWGDYSAMTLDLDGCTFWYTTEYYPVQIPNNGTPSSGNGDFHTRIGHFRYPTSACRPVAAPCATSPFDDVPTSHPFCAEIQWMKDQEISTGFGDNTYRPSIAVTRQAMSAFMVRLAPLLP